MAFKSKHEQILKKEGYIYTSTAGILFFGVEADLKAIQFSFFLGIIETLSTQLLKNKNKISAVDA